MPDDTSSHANAPVQEPASESQSSSSQDADKAQSYRADSPADAWKPGSGAAEETGGPHAFAASPLSGRTVDDLPDAEYAPAATTQDLLGWGLFWRFFFSQSGLLFLLAGIICFFAFNWASLAGFAKFCLIIAMLLASLGLAVHRGPDSSAGGLGLLACGLLAGPLLAVYGQVYQTGANASELFQVWATLLFPLALASKRTSLWLCFWFLGSTWLGLHLAEQLRFGWESLDYDELWQAGLSATRLMLMAQLGFLVLWELCSSLLHSPARGFLYSQLLPRLICLFVLGLLTWQLCSQIIYLGDFRYYHEDRASGLDTFFRIAYVAVLVLGGYWYTRRRPDALILAMGMLSIIITAVFFVFSHESMWTITGAFFGAVMVIAASAAAERLLRAQLKYSREAREQWDERRREAAQWLEGTRATQKVRRVSVLPTLANWQALQFSLTSRLSLEEKKKRHDQDESSPWFVRILIGLCAWIALPMLLAFIGLLFVTVFSIDSLWPVFIFSLMGLGFSSMLSKSQALFVQQFGLALALASTIAAIASLGFETRMDFEDVLPMAACICAGGFFVVRNRAYKFGAALAVLLLIALWFSVHFMPSYSYYYDYSDYREDGEPGLYAIQEIIGGMYYSALALLTVRLFFAPDKERNSGWADPLRVALLATFVCIPLALLFRPLHFPISPANYMAGIGAGVGLGWYVIRALRPFHVAPATRIFFLAAAMAISIASWWYPWLGAGFFCLALARRERSLPLVGLAVAFLVLALNLEYYFMGTSLLMKSLFLCLTGILFLAGALAISRLLASGIHAKRLPAPLELLRAGTDEPQEQTPEQPGQGGDFIPARQDRVYLLRQGIAAAVILLFLAGFAFSVHGKETHLAEGTKMYLRIAPVDPRSLMQGDYMVLDFAITDAIYRAENSVTAHEYPASLKRRAVVQLDSRGIASFVRLAGENEQLQAGEHFVQYKGWGWDTRVGSGSFFFQEGHGEFYEGAAFAEMRVDSQGTVLITHLLDADLQRIEPGNERAAR